MVLPRESALRFIEGYKAVLLRVLSDLGIARTDSITQDLATARTHTKSKPDLIARAAEALDAIGQVVELEVVTAIKSMKVDQWTYLRQTKSFAVFLDKEADNAYEVRALTTPLYELVGGPPVIFEAGLFEYDDVFVCDGIALNPVIIGRGYRAQLNAAYSAIRKAGRLHRVSGERDR